MERYYEIDRGLARANEEHRVAARETVEDARVPGVPNVPFTLKGRPISMERMPAAGNFPAWRARPYTRGRVPCPTWSGARAPVVRDLSRTCSMVVPPARAATPRAPGLGCSPDTTCGEGSPRGPRGPPVPVPRQEVLWILREGSHASSRDVQQQVVYLAGIGWSHGAFVATIEHPNADIGIGRCEPEQVQREQPP